MALRIHQVNVHGWKIRALTVLFDGIVRCEKSGAHYDAMERDENDEPFREFSALTHFATRCGADARIGPVEQYIREEISSYQENHREKNAADNYIEIASQNGFEKKRAEAGPAHDHFDEQRTAQERAPTLNPKREMSGFAAARSA